MLVKQVYAGPARDAGIQRGDVITDFDGEAVENAEAMERLVESLPAGSIVHCRVVRNKRPQFLALKVPAE